jgi:ATP-dependent DNA helicase RecG
MTRGTGEWNGHLAEEPCDILEAAKTSARVLREFGLLEEWGTGYRRVTEDCRVGGYPAPEWEERGPALRVVFRPHPEVAAAADETVGVSSRETVNEIVSETINVRQRWFMEQLAAGNRTRWTDLAVHWSVSRATAMRDIASLHQQESIEYVGAPKNGFYRIKAPSS